VAASPTDRGIVRDLAKRVAEIASLPVMAERRELWRAHNSLRPTRPMILVFPEGAWCELLPDSELLCEDEELRGIERELRRRIYYHERIKDDTVIEAEWSQPKRVRNSGWGIEPRRVESAGERGAWGFDPVIRERKDLEKLKLPEVTLDEKETARAHGLVLDLFGDLLDVRLRGVRRVSFHLMNIYCRLRGLEQVMMDMYDEPGMLHDAMAFLERGSAATVRQYVEQNLLDLNNDGTYHSSGGNGYTDDLPAEGFDPGRIRPRDMWASAESQEMAQVSPEMHAEFALRYERPLLEPFGLTGYGCCEDLTRKLDHVLTIPNLRRISISPWADVEKCAERLADGYVFSWKPDPAHLVGEFDEQRLRRYVRHALDATRGCAVEMILKDTHTCENHPERFTRWVEIARELVEEACCAAGAG
jgi:hypothetical protein